MLRHFQKKLRDKSTLPEYRLWEFLRNRRLDGFKFRRQQVIENYIVDFICYEAKLIIELDGSHHAEQEQIEKDLNRTTILERQGFKVVRFWNDEVQTDIGLVLTEISRILQGKAPLIRRCAPPSPTRGEG